MNPRCSRGAENIYGNLQAVTLIHFEVSQHLYARINCFCAPLIKSRYQEELAQFCAFINSLEVNSIFNRQVLLLTSLAPEGHYAKSI